MNHIVCLIFHHGQFYKRSSNKYEIEHFCFYLNTKSNIKRLNKILKTNTDAKTKVWRGTVVQARQVWGFFFSSRFILHHFSIFIAFNNPYWYVSTAVFHHREEPLLSRCYRRSSATTKIQTPDAHEADTNKKDNIEVHTGVRLVPTFNYNQRSNNEMLIYLTSLANLECAFVSKVFGDTAVYQINYK